jgi:hypothetical protein
VGQELDQADVAVLLEVPHGRHETGEQSGAGLAGRYVPKTLRFRLHSVVCLLWNAEST